MPMPQTFKPDQTRTSVDVSFRASGKEPGLEGHAASWWSVDSWYTAMAPGAFKRSIRMQGVEKIPVLWNHNQNAPIGKHLAIREDDHGLFVSVAIDENDGAEGATLMSRLRFGVPLAMSFGFETVKDRPGTKDDPLTFHQFKAKPEDIRVIEEVKYWESSPVTFPANSDSTIDAIRSAHLEQQAEFLASFLEDMRSGVVKADDARLPLLRQIVALLPDPNDPAPDPIAETTPLVDSEEARRRTRQAEITLTLARAQGWIGALA